MMVDSKAALFLMLGQLSNRTIRNLDNIVPSDPLLLSESYDLAAMVPEKVRKAGETANAYKFFYVFENYLREFVVEILSRDGVGSWWDKVPTDVQTEVLKLEETEEIKSWMALGSRDKSALLTLPQLLRVIDHSWKSGFDEVVRDKSLIQSARMLVHLRNTVCHMSELSQEELDRIKQTMRDWFRIVAP